MLDFGDEVIKFKLKGKEYEVEKPNNGQIKEYSAKLKDCKEDDNEAKEEALINFLAKLGLSREVYNLLKPNQLKMILESLYEAEKN